ncbi:MAG: hypothetical protein IKW10_04135 [Oscillospiraceae bacterium]|nr:hypothetical protein [Oscillospiraceae bacterium]
MQNGAKMAVRIIAGILVLALVAGLVVMAVSAAEDDSFAAGESYYQLSADVDGIVIDHDLLLDLNGYDATNVTVNEGVTVRLMDSANDSYDAEACGSLSGTIIGTVEQLVQYDTKNYLVICQDGVYSAHRFYAGISSITLVTGNVSLGYKATFLADSVINAMVSSYGYCLSVNDYAAKEMLQYGAIEKSEMTLLLTNILSENASVSKIGATATIYGNAIIAFNLEDSVVEFQGNVHDITLREAVEAVNETLHNDRNAYSAAQVQAVRDMYNTYADYMTDWSVDAILSEDKFVPVENVTATYGETLTLGQLFAAAEGANIGEVAVSIEDVEATYAANADWTQATITFNGIGTATITITDNDLCWAATNTVEIGKATIDAPAVDTLNATYGDDLSTVALPQGFSWVSTGSVGNAGENTFIAKYDNGDANYNTVEVEVVVSVSKADPEVPPVDELTATEGDALSTITLPVGFAWANGDETVTLEKTEYEATYSNGDPNYNTVDVNIPVVVTAKPVEILDKFAQKMPEVAFTYRLGNGNTVALGSIFAAVEGAEIDSASVKVTVSALDDCVVSGAYTANASDWTKGTLKFEDTGLVEITIKDATSNEFSLTFEIVNANNATGASSATANNVVLLNNDGFSNLTVSNGYTLFGNGFTLTSTSENYADSFKDCYVALDNGTLDNVRIVVPFFANGFLYQSQATSDVAGPYDRTYYNFRSAIYSTGDSKILNSYISGGRAGVYAVSGNPVLENTTIYGGAVANIHIGVVQSITLKDMTLIQKPIEGTVQGNAATAKSVMGFGVVFEIGAEGTSPVLNLEGYLNQFAWANETYSSYMPEKSSDIITIVKRQSDFLHNIRVDGVANEEWVNLGIAYWPLDRNSAVLDPTINDNRTNKTEAPYEKRAVTALSTTAYVYSIVNTNQHDVNTPVEPTIQNNAPTAPMISFNDAGTGKTFVTEYKPNTGWMSTVTVDLDTTGDYTFDFANLVASKYGKSLSYTVEGLSGNTVVLNDSGVDTYKLNITDNEDCNGDVIHTYTFVLTATKTSIAAPELVAQPSGDALLVVKGKDSDWTVGIPALEGTQIKYYSKTSKEYKTLSLSSIVPKSKGKQNSTNNYWSYSDANGDYTFKVTCGYIHDTKQIYGMPVVVDNSGNKMYFTISSTNGYVSTNTASRAVTLTYEFTDANGQTITFSKSWSCNRSDMINAGAKQYSYDDFCNGTLKEASGNSGSCVAPETLITLADGNQVRVDSLTGSEQLLVWNMETGKLDSAPIMFVDNDPTEEYEIVHLYFSDGTDVKVIYEHGFWDYDLNRYVYLDKDAADYIGHTFAKQNGNELTRVQLVDVVIEKEITEAWSPVTCGHLCYFVNGMLSMPGGVGGLFNIFDVNPETMTYDYEAMARDIETYGLFTYEEMNSIVELPEEMFEAAGGAFLKISMGKGNLTMDELIAMIVRYTKYF